MMAVQNVACERYTAIHTHYSTTVVEVLTFNNIGEGILVCFGDESLEEGKF